METVLLYAMKTYPCTTDTGLPTVTVITGIESVRWGDSAAVRDENISTHDRHGVAYYYKLWARYSWKHGRGWAAIVTRVGALWRQYCCGRREKYIHV